MTLVAHDKSSVVTSFSFCLSTNILQVLLAMALGLFGFTTSVTADVLSDRKLVLSRMRPQ